MQTSLALPHCAHPHLSFLLDTACTPGVFGVAQGDKTLTSLTNKLTSYPASPVALPSYHRARSLLHS